MNLLTHPNYLEFGYTRRGHQLISKESIDFPYELLSLTDIPPSQPTKWEYTLNCAPIGNVFCIWCIKPDLTQTRTGTVKSTVAILPLDDFIEIETIDHIVSKLLGLDLQIFPLDSQNQLKIINTIIDSKKTCITNNFEIWPNIICSLWKLLWPAARKNFSFHCIFKEQDTIPNLNPTLYCQANSQTIHLNNNLIEIEKEGFINTKNICSLILNKKSSDFLFFKDLIHEYSNLNDLSLLDKMINSYNSHKENPTIDSAIKCLRISKTIKNEKNEILKSIIDDTINYLNSNLYNINIDQLFKLSNIELSVDNPINLKQLIIFKIDDFFNLEKIENILSASLENQACKWWCNEINEGFTYYCNETDNLLPHFLTIFSNHNSSIIFSKIIKDIKALGNKMYEKYDLKKIKVNLFFLDFCLKNNLGEIHALTVSQLYDSDSSLKRQLQFVDKNNLKILIDNYPDNSIIESVVKKNDITLSKFTIDRILKDSSIIDSLDVHNEIWISIWEHCLKNNNKIFPKNNPKSHIINSIFDIIIRENNIKSCYCSLINLIYIDDEISSTILNYQNRSKIWDYFLPPQKDFILRQVAEKLLTLLYLKNFTQPEYLLTTQVIDLAKNKPFLSYNATLQLIQWPLVNEKEAKVILSRWDWSDNADKIGHIILKRQWTSIAEYLYSDYKKGNKKFKSAIPSIKDLLPRFERLKLKVFDSKTFSTSTAKITSHEINELIIEYCSELLSDRLKSIWLKVGGKPSDLITQGTIYDQWVHAINLASNGRVHGGTKTLVQILVQEYPYNNELKDLLKFFD